MSSVLFLKKDDHVNVWFVQEFIHEVTLKYIYADIDKSALSEETKREFENVCEAGIPYFNFYKLSRSEQLEFYKTAKRVYERQKMETNKGNVEWYEGNQDMVDRYLNLFQELIELIEQNTDVTGLDLSIPSQEEPEHNNGDDKNKLSE